MPSDLLITVAILGAAAIMFVLNRPRMDAVALMALLALTLTGVVSLSEALAGFSDPNILLIAALFVVGDSLARTGVAQRLGDWLLHRAGRQEARQIALLMTIVATTGSVMSSTAVVALFLPVALRIARGSGIAASRLMMPLSIAALISGMLTLVATAPNLVVNGELTRRGFEGFHFFAITPFGVCILGLGIGYMLFARRWLAGRRSATAAEARPSLAGWIDEYGLAGREFRLRIASGSSLAGRTLEQLDLRATSGINIIAIERRGPIGGRMIRPTAATDLRAGDVLFLDLFGPTLDIEQACRKFGLEKLPLTGAYFLDLSQDIGMAELLLPPTSELVGKTVVDARFRSEYGLAVVGLKRGNTAHKGELLQEPLRAGDTLLTVGPWNDIRRLQSNWRDLIVLGLPTELDDVVPAGSRAPHALAVLGLVILLMVSGVVPNLVAVLIGCLLLGLFRCIDFDSAYRAIHWQSLVLIVGMLPFAVALQKTGGIDLAAAGLMQTLGEAGPRVVLAGLFTVTAMLGIFISNTATAVLMAPIALAVAEGMQASPYPFAMTVALAASTAFMAPISSPVNTLVVGPGGYTFADFLRVGVPFSIIVMAATVLLVPLLLPF